jgi:hypothetical protein
LSYDSALTKQTLNETKRNETSQRTNTFTPHDFNPNSNPYPYPNPHSDFFVASQQNGDGSLTLDEILERTNTLALEQENEDTAAAIGAATEDVELQFTGNAKV